jgi:integrase
MWRAHIVTAVTCGLRPGEQLGLRWEDVDTAEGTIRVRMCLKALPGPDGKHVLRLADLKTDRSRRTMQLPRDAATVLRALKAQQAKDPLLAGSAYTDSGLVFAATSGGPRWPQDVRHEFAKLCERAGLGKGWHPHETRHTWLSVLSASGGGPRGHRRRRRSRHQRDDPQRLPASAGGQADEGPGGHGQHPSPGEVSGS